MPTARTRAARGLALLIWSATVVLDVAAGLSAFLPMSGTAGSGFTKLLIPFGLLFVQVTAVVGALIAWRRPGNPIGWLFGSAALSWSVSVFGVEYATRALVTQPGLLSGGELMAWLSSWIGLLPTCVLVTFLPLLFPNGHLPSPGWRPVAWAAGLGIAIVGAGAAFAPGPLSSAFVPIDNPFGIEGLPAGLPGIGGLVAISAGGVLSATSLLVRLRRAAPIERQQLKWFGLAATAIVFGFILAGADYLTSGYPPTSLAGQLVVLALFAAMIGIPVSTGIAILRYRLYDIDVVINRALVYGTLTAGLGITYWGAILLLQPLLRPLMQGSDLATAGSTLIIVILFRPARQHIQRAVDRRFYRQRYDAVRTLESFSARLRGELDLEALGSELLHVTRQTMQPQRLSLWLRRVERKR